MYVPDLVYQVIFHGLDQQDHYFPSYQSEQSMQFAISYIMHQSVQSMGLAITQVRKFHAVSCFVNHQSAQSRRFVVSYVISPCSPCGQLFSIPSVHVVHAVRYFLYRQASVRAVFAVLCFLYHQSVQSMQFVFLISQQLTKPNISHLSNLNIFVRV